MQHKFQNTNIIICHIFLDGNVFCCYKIQIHQYPIFWFSVLIFFFYNV